MPNSHESCQRRTTLLGPVDRVGGSWERRLVPAGEVAAGAAPADDAVRVAVDLQGQMRGMVVEDVDDRDDAFRWYARRMQDLDHTLQGTPDPASTPHRPEHDLAAVARVVELHLPVLRP